MFSTILDVYRDNFERLLALPPEKYVFLLKQLDDSFLPALSCFFRRLPFQVLRHLLLSKTKLSQTAKDALVEENFNYLFCPSKHPSAGEEARMAIFTELPWSYENVLVRLMIGLSDKEPLFELLVRNDQLGERFWLALSPYWALEPEKGQSVFFAKALTFSFLQRHMGIPKMLSSYYCRVALFEKNDIPPHYREQFLNVDGQLPIGVHKFNSYLRVRQPHYHEEVFEALFERGEVRWGYCLAREFLLTHRPSERFLRKFFHLLHEEVLKGYSLTTADTVCPFQMFLYAGMSKSYFLEVWPYLTFRDQMFVAKLRPAPADFFLEKIRDREVPAKVLVALSANDTLTLSLYNELVLHGYAEQLLGNPMTIHRARAETRSAISRLPRSSLLGRLREILLLEYSVW